MVDPIFDGLRRTMQLPGNLGDRSMAEENFFGGVTLESVIITRRTFFR